MRNQDEHEEQILLEFFACLSVDRAEFMHDRAGAMGTRPDFRVELRRDQKVVGIELTKITTEADERAPRAMSSIVEDLGSRIRRAVDENPVLRGRLEGKGLMLQLSGLPPKARIRALVPRVVAWIESVSSAPDSVHSPTDADVRAVVGELRIVQGIGSSPIVSVHIGGRSDDLSVIETLRRKRAIAEKPDFRRFGETWLVMYGPMASICATCYALGPDELREAVACLAERVFDRLFLFNPGEKEVWEFGWNRIAGL